MPRGTYKRTVEMNTGKWKRNKEQQKKLQKLRKGKVPWNKDKKRPPFSKEWLENIKKARAKRGLYSEKTKKKISESHKGNKNPSWRGGISPENRIIRRSKEMRLWRESVFKRDNWTCVWCHSRKDLQADHIKSFAQYPKLRFEITNGRTLCKPCHLKTETWGYRICFNKDKIDQS